MENLKALVYKGDLTPYQRALAQREFEGLIERLELYEKAVKNNAVLPLVRGAKRKVCDQHQYEYYGFLIVSKRCKVCGYEKM